MAPWFQLVLFTLHFLCSRLGMFTRPVIKNSAGAPSSAKGGTRCVCLAALTSTAAHRLQLGFGRGDHSHPCGSSRSGCYQQRRQATVVSTRAAAAVGKVGGLHLARVNFLLQPPPTTHQFSFGRLLCLAGTMKELPEWDNLRGRESQKHVVGPAPFKDNEVEALRV